MKKRGYAQSFDDLTRELIRIKPAEVNLAINRNIGGNSEFKRCVVEYNLEYSFLEQQKKSKLFYGFEHPFLINDLNPKGLAKLLHEDLLRILHQGQKLKSRGINLNLNGMGLSYIGHGHYLPSGELDILTLPTLLMDIKKRYGLRDNAK